MMIRAARITSLVALLAPSLMSPVVAQCNGESGLPDSLPTAWSRIDFSRTRITAKQLDAAHFAAPQLAQIRATIFGRHGRIFLDCDERSWLEDQKWYKADKAFTNARLTAADRWNLDIVRAAEAAKHEHVELGDMRFWADSVFPIDRYPVARGDYLRLMAAEFEAIHGRRFEDTPWMQRYFNDRYWYEPSDTFSAQQLTKPERRNRQIIDSLLRGSGASIRPGEMAFHVDAPITDSMLAGVTLWDLRILRNEVYALHGRKFQTAWLRRYFTDRTWYEPRAGYSDNDLTPIDLQNIATIVAAENRIHESLSTTPLDTALVAEISYEEIRKLRNEIYARHGRRFKDPSLQEYFSSMSWYQPNPSFEESDLSDIEQKNAELLLKLEVGRTKEIGLYEG